ncbi:MAG: PrgI family protein, partial [Candidatus Staskawiczbacteria bacterium]|nr:PrgI family protein [Candidatus Staskawiczbacteria bacterium]
MEQYPIPQFIEQEGKIAFFISFRQFFYLVGAGGACFILYFILPKVLFLLLAPLIFIGTLILAFA